MPLPFAAITIVVCALWASVGIAIKICLVDAPPLGLAAVRMAVAATALWFWLWSRAPVRLTRQQWYPVAITTIFYALLQGFTNLGFEGTSAARGIVLLNTTPLFVAVLAPFIGLREDLTVVKSIGLIVAFFGVVTIFAHRLGGASTARGDFFMILAALSWGFHTLWTKRAAKEVDSRTLMLFQIAGAAVPLAILSAGGESISLWHLTPRLALCTLYLALCGTVLSWLLWVHVLKNVAASTASSFIFTVPLFGIVLSWLFLGEAITWQFLAGACLVSVGILVVNYRKAPTIAASVGAK
jgi:drug/metabolite transporter (DMT)-like permease